MPLRTQHPARRRQPRSEAPVEHAGSRSAEAKVRRTGRHSAEKRALRKKARYAERDAQHTMRIESGRLAAKEKLERKLKAEARLQRSKARRAHRRPHLPTIQEVMALIAKRRRRWKRYLERCDAREKKVHHTKREITTVVV